jgi:hypothetical protein
VVDRGGLENRCPFTGTVGSNPTASANLIKSLEAISDSKDRWFFTCQWESWLRLYLKSRYAGRTSARYSLMNLL